MLEQISDSTWLNGAANFLLAVGAVLSILLGKKLAMPSANAGERSGATVEVAGALIDGKDARDLRDALHEATRAMTRCAEATEDNAHKIEHATTQIQRMTDELIRSQR